MKQEDLFKIIIIEDDAFLRGLLKRQIKEVCKTLPCRGIKFDIGLYKTIENGVNHITPDTRVVFLDGYIMKTKQKGYGGVSIPSMIRLKCNGCKVIVSSSINCTGSIEQFKSILTRFIHNRALAKAKRLVVA